MASPGFTPSGGCPTPGCCSEQSCCMGSCMSACEPSDPGDMAVDMAEAVSGETADDLD